MKGSLTQKMVKMGPMVLTVKTVIVESLLMPKLTTKELPSTTITQMVMVVATTTMEAMFTNKVEVLGFQLKQALDGVNRLTTMVSQIGGTDVPLTTTPDCTGMEVKPTKTQNL